MNRKMIFTIHWLLFTKVTDSATTYIIFKEFVLIILNSSSVPDGKLIVNYGFEIDISKEFGQLADFTMIFSSTKINVNLPKSIEKWAFDTNQLTPIKRPQLIALMDPAKMYPICSTCIVGNVMSYVTVSALL